MIRPRMRALLACAVFLVACEATAGRRPRAVPMAHDGPFTSWWNDEIIKERGEYRHGKRHGEIEAFHADGSLALEATFKDGVPVGPVSTYHPGGSLMRTESIEDGLLHGVRSSYSTSGVLVEETHFVEGRKHGTERHWREDGGIAGEGDWRADVPVGPWSHFDPLGRLVRVERYWVIGGVPTGYLETVYVAEGVVSVQTLRRRVNDVWSGWETTWHGNGRQASLVEYRDGQRHGRDVSWDRTGRLVSEGRREKDKRTGTWTFFGGRGEGSRTVVYADGEVVGPEGLEGSGPEGSLERAHEDG